MSTRGVDVEIEDIKNFLQEAHAYMNAAAGRVVFIAGSCGGDCSRRCSDAEALELLADFAEKMACAAENVRAAQSRLGAMTKPEAEEPSISERGMEPVSPFRLVRKAEV